MEQVAGGGGPTGGTQSGPAGGVGQEAPATDASGPTVETHEAPEVEPSTTGTTDVDAYLNAHVTGDDAQQAVTRSRDWIDDVNDVRGNPFGEAVINTGERLIPIYGAWDSVRDTWNGYAEQMEMFEDDWVMSTILTLQGIVSLVGDLVSHIEYCAKLLGYIAYVAKGAGAVLNALTSATIGWIPIVCDAINFVLGVIGSCYASYRASKASDPQERARWEWLTYKQTEHMVVSLASGVAGLVIQAATAGQAPSTVGRELAQNAVTGLAGGLVKGGMKALFGLAAPETRPAPVDPYGRLPKDIFGDIASVGYLITDEGTQARSDLDRFVTGGPAPAPVESANEVAPILDRSHEQAAPAGPERTPPEEVDHSPEQVDALLTAESNLEAALATSTENVAASETRASDAEAMAGQLAGAEENLTAMEGGAQTSQGNLESAVPVGESMVASLGEMSGAFGELGQPLGQLGQSTATAQQGASTRVQPDEDRSLLERARDWIIERTMRAFLPAQGQLGGMAGQASGQVSAGTGGSSSSAGKAEATRSEEAASLAETRAAAAEASATVGEVQGARDTVTSERTEAEEVHTEAVAEAEQHRSEREAIEAELEVVRAERERQEAANEAFRDEWGEWFEAQAQAQGAQAEATTPEAIAEGLWEAHDALDRLGSGYIAEGEALIATVPTAAVPQAREILESFVTSHETRLAQVAGLVGEAVGASGDGVEAAVARAEGALLGAEQEMMEAWSQVCGALLQLSELELDEDANVAPAQDEPAEPLT